MFHADEHKGETPNETLSKNIITGNENAVLKTIETSPKLFLEPLSKPFHCLKSTVFGEQTTPLGILIWTRDPMLFKVLESLREKGLGNEVDIYCKSFMFTGVMVSINGQEMHQERYYDFSPLKNNSEKGNAPAVHDALKNVPGWVPQALCANNSCDMITIFSYREFPETFRKHPRSEQPHFTEDPNKTSWEDFLKSDDYCGISGRRWGHRYKIDLLRKGETMGKNTLSVFDTLDKGSFSIYQEFAEKTHKLKVTPQLTLPVMKSDVKIPNDFYCTLTDQFLKKPAFYSMARQGAAWFHYELDALIALLKEKTGLSNLPPKPSNTHNYYPFEPTEHESTQQRINLFKTLNPELFYDPITGEELSIPPRNIKAVAPQPAQQTRAPETKTPQTESGSSQLGVFGSRSAGAATPVAITQAENPPAEYKTEIPDKYRCTLTKKLMTAPVQYIDGHIYEKSALTDWLLKQNLSPVGAKIEVANISKLLEPLPALEKEIQQFNKQNASPVTTSAVHVHTLGRSPS